MRSGAYVLVTIIVVGGVACGKSHERDSGVRDTSPPAIDSGTWDTSTRLVDSGTVDAGSDAGDGGTDGAAPGRGLVAEWLFDGNAQDTSGNGHHGMVTQALLALDRHGASDAAYSFDGLDDVISVPYGTGTPGSPDLNLGATTSGLTIEAWVRPTERKTQTIVRSSRRARRAYSLGLAGTGRIVANVSDASLARRSLTVTGPDYPIDTWFHVAVTWDGSTLRIYLDGAEVARDLFRGPIAEDEGPLLIGTRINLVADTFAGTIDDVRLFEVARSQAQICSDAELSGIAPCP